MKVPEGVKFGNSSIKNGTIYELVEELTPPSDPDKKFKKEFLLTCPAFVKSDELFQLLVDRYTLQQPSDSTMDAYEWTCQVLYPIKGSVLEVLGEWLEFYIKDPEVVKEGFSSFCEEHLKVEHPAVIPAIKERFDIAMIRTNSSYVLDRCDPQKTKFPSSNIPKRSTADLELLDIDPLELARQLTLMEYSFYCRIIPKECLRKSWSDRKNNTAYNIREVIDSTNKISQWVSSTILNEEDKNKRIKLVKHFIVVSHNLLKIKNYNTCMAIVSAINSAPIHRLNQTWEMIYSKYRKLLREVEEAISSEHNFALYRKIIEAAKPPCIPFLGLYLTDLTFIDDGNQDFLDEEKTVINFDKYHMTAEVILKILFFQNCPFPFREVPSILTYLKNNFDKQDVSDQYDISIKMEPKEKDIDTMKRWMNAEGFWDD